MPPPPPPKEEAAPEGAQSPRSLSLSLSGSLSFRLSFWGMGEAFVLYTPRYLVPSPRALPISCFYPVTTSSFGGGVVAMLLLGPRLLCSGPTPVTLLVLRAPSLSQPTMTDYNQPWYPNHSAKPPAVHAYGARHQSPLVPSLSAARC